MMSPVTYLHIAEARPSDLKIGSIAGGYVGG